MKKPIPYSEEEINYIRDAWQFYTALEIAEIIDRPRDSVYAKIRELREQRILKTDLEKEIERLHKIAIGIIE